LSRFKLFIIRKSFKFWTNFQNSGCSASRYHVFFWMYFYDVFPYADRIASYEFAIWILESTNTSFFFRLCFLAKFPQRNSASTTRFASCDFFST